MTSRLQSSACRALCRWESTGRRLDGEALLRCRGCRTEWVRSEAWTPLDHTGEVPDAVQAERRRGRG